MADQLFGSNKEIYQAEADRVSCGMYNPCPICLKCMNKASHLYVECAGCQIPVCGHNDKIRGRMIRRENFAITVSDEVAEALKEMAKKADGDGN